MRNLIAIVFMLGSTARASVYSQYPQPHAVPKGAKIVASVNNIPIAFDETAGSKIISSISPKGQQFIRCSNQTGSDVEIVTADSAPISTTTQKFPVPAGSFVENPNYPISENVYAQSDTGAPIVAGTLRCNVW